MSTSATVRVIGFDFNKVVVDTRHGLWLACCKVSGLLLPQEQFDGRNLVGRDFPLAPPRRGFGTFTQEHYEGGKCLFFEEEFLRYATPCSGAVSGLQKMAAQGFRLAMVTDSIGLPVSVVDRFWRKYHLPSCERNFTRKRESKQGFYELCDVVVDNERTHLDPLINHEGVALYHMLPAPGATGYRAVARPPGLSSRIVSVRDCEEVCRKAAAQFKLAA